MAALEHPPVQQRLGRQLQLFEDGGLQRLGRMAERQLDVGQAQHAPDLTRQKRNFKPSWNVTGWRRVRVRGSVKVGVTRPALLEGSK